jgi:hypothetical protein
MYYGCTTSYVAIGYTWPTRTAGTLGQTEHFEHRDCGLPKKNKSKVEILPSISIGNKLLPYHRLISANK